MDDYVKAKGDATKLKGHSSYKFYNSTGILILLITYCALTVVYLIYNATMSVFAVLWHKEAKEVEDVKVKV